MTDGLENHAPYDTRGFGDEGLILVVGLLLTAGLFFVLLWWLTSKIGRRR